jgi:tRNA pseudouridine13 synthase
VPGLSVVRSIDFRMTIRRVPEDFRVVEELRAEFLRLLGARDSTRRTAVYRLDKRGTTTPAACARLARALGVRAGAVTWAGLKDMHAVTSQHVGIRNAPPDSPADLRGESWHAALVGWSTHPPDASDIEHNRFEIVIRNLTPDQARSMRERAALFQSGPGLLLVNYFGEQRFTSGAHGKGFAGAALVRGDFETALRLLVGVPTRKESKRRRAVTRAYATHWGDWPAVVEACPRGTERRPGEVLAAGGDFREAFAALPNLTQVMAVEAFQSLLWNRAAARILRAACPRVIETPSPFGALVFPEFSCVPPDLRSLRAPMPSSEMTSDDLWGKAMLTELMAEGLTAPHLRVPGLRRPTFGAGTRSLFVNLPDFLLDDPAPDDLSRCPGRLKRRVVFTLPRGAYATVVLRALGH